VALVAAWETVVLHLDAWLTGLSTVWHEGSTKNTLGILLLTLCEELPAIGVDG